MRSRIPAIPGPKSLCAVNSCIGVLDHSCSSNAISRSESNRNSSGEMMFHIRTFADLSSSVINASNLAEILCRIAT